MFCFLHSHHFLLVLLLQHLTPFPSSVLKLELVATFVLERQAVCSCECFEELKSVNHRFHIRDGMPIFARTAGQMPNANLPHPPNRDTKKFKGKLSYCSFCFSVCYYTMNKHI